MDKTNPKIDLSVIIVNYKSWQHLSNCLHSLDFDPGQFSFEIIVVDNCSNDGKLEEFQELFPKVNFILNSGNNGFANGCNVGAKESIGNFLLFLNPDTIANSTALAKMFQYAKQHPAVGITSCKQKNLKGGFEKVHREFLSLFTLFGFFRMFGKLFRSNKNISDQEIVFTDWVSGSVVFMSREWFHQIGGWNEDYWMYYEDMDLSKKVHESNGKVAVLTSCEILHNHGGSSRLNLKTASLTKNEVQISKHVFISNHFGFLEKQVSFFILITFNIISKFILAVFGILLFFIPKMRLNVYLFSKLIAYYTNSLSRLSWLSINSLNNKQ